MKKSVLVTGASGDIGSNIVKAFAAEGYAVAIHYNKNMSAAQNLCDMLLKNGAVAVTVGGDLSKDTIGQKVVCEAAEKLGSLDVLVNNAGTSLVKPFLDTSDEQGKELIQTDLTAAIECSKYAAKYMLKNGGSIINISSVWGICGASCEVYYSAAKAGMIGFTKALAAELAPSNIRVNAVAPGVIDTKMNACFSESERRELLDRIPASRFGNGYDVAKAALFLASGDAGYITGQVLNVSGGFLI